MDLVASRYADALVSIAKDENKLQEYKVAILSIQESLRKEPDLFKYLKSYFVSNLEKQKVIEELTKEFNLANLTNFINLLVSKHKIHIFKDIVKEFTKGINYELDIFEGFVYSVSPLSEERIKQIEDVISKKINKKVELTNKLDERLIGGVKVVVHDYVFDGSINYKIETMKENLKERRTANEN